MVNDQTVSILKIETGFHDIFFFVHVSSVFFLIYPPFSLLFCYKFSCFPSKWSRKLLKCKCTLFTFCMLGIYIVLSHPLIKTLFF